MIRAFNKHYRKAIDLIESCSTSEKMEVAEKRSPQAGYLMR